MADKQVSLLDLHNTEVIMLRKWQALTTLFPCILDKC